MFFGNLLADTVGPYWTHVIKNATILLAGIIIGVIAFLFVLGREYKAHTRKDMKEKDVLFFAFRENDKFHSFSSPRRWTDWFYIVPLHFYYRYFHLGECTGSVAVKFEDVKRSKYFALAFAIIAVFLVVYGIHLCFHVTNYYGPDDF